MNNAVRLMVVLALTGMACEERIGETAAMPDASADLPAAAGSAGAPGAGGTGGSNAGAAGSGGCIPKPAGGEGGANIINPEAPPEGKACPVEGLEVCGGAFKCVNGVWTTLKPDAGHCSGDCHPFHQTTGMCCSGGAIYCPGVGLCDGTQWWTKEWSCQGQLGDWCDGYGELRECCLPYMCGQEQKCAVIPCGVSGVCPDPLVCEANVCVFITCDSEATCPAPLTCTGGQCRFETCTEAKPCSNGLKCVQGYCRPG